MDYDQSSTAKPTARYERLESDFQDQLKLQQEQPKPKLSQKTLNLNKYAVACAIMASMNSILLGYDVGVTSGAMLFIKEDLKIDEFEEEVLVSILSFVSLGGSAVAGRLADALGRRWTMALAALVFLFGASLMGFAPSYSFLMLGRILAGFGVGLALMVAPVYTAEVAPASSRGSLVSLPEIFINVGLLIGFVSNYAFSGLPVSLAWRVMLGLGVLPALALAVGVIFMPESPRWLVMQGRIDEARVVITKTSTNAEEAEKRLKEIMEAAGFLVNGESEECYQAQLCNRADNNGQNIWRELVCPSRDVRRMLAIASGIQFFQQASGVDAVVYYSPEVFKAAGITGKSAMIAGTVAMGCIKCAFILVATIYLDSVGRRPLLLASTCGITVSLTGVALAFLFVDSQGLPANASSKVPPVAVFIVFCICTYAAFFSIGMGPVGWVVTTEVFPLRLRAQAMSLCIIVSRLTSTVVSLTFLSVARAVTFSGAYLVFAILSICSVVFVFYCIPETKGKSLEEVTKLLFKDGCVELDSHKLVEQDDECQEKYLQGPETGMNSGDERNCYSGEQSTPRKDLVAKVRAIAHKSPNFAFKRI